MEIYPDYYGEFKCIADKCKHSCCIGWEIDIDDDTMDFYNNLDTELGEKIRQNIEGDIPHFALKEGDRCPFLKKNGLCEIILSYGEDAICDICTLHPRFFNWYLNFEEVGLGLCCEEAVRIILTRDEKVFIPTPTCELTVEEEELFATRKKIFDILQNRDKTIGERFSILGKKFNLRLDFSKDKLCELYLSLERLDEKWDDELKGLKGAVFDESIFKDCDTAFEQLAVYFIFRHLKPNEDYRAVVRFALMSCYVIVALWSRYDDFDKKLDLVRMYSSEVEYSEENMEALLRVEEGSLYE